MKVQIQRDQAVWERENFKVEIPDGLEGDERDEAILEAIHSFSNYEGDSYRKEVLDAVMSFSTQTMATLPDGTEIDL